MKYIDMKVNTKRVIMSAAGLLLSAGNALALDGNVTAAANTNDIVNNLGLFSGSG